MGLTGYDVSTFQRVDHDQLACDFLLIRDVYSTSVVDDQFAYNLAGARRTGRLRGSYSFAEPGYDRAADALAFTLKAHDAYQPGELQLLDQERDIGPAVVDWSLEWLTLFERACGFKPGIYLNRDLLHRYDWSRVIAGDFALWLAVGDAQPDDFSGDPDLGGWPVLALKQYILAGPVVAGVTGGGLDYDSFNGDAAAFQRCGAPGVPVVVAPAPPPAPAPAVGVDYTVQAGDTLSGIAARCGITWQDLLGFSDNASRIPNPDLIYAGEVVRTPANVGPAPPAPPPSGCEYTVQAGDTLSGIASDHSMNWSDLWSFGGNRALVPNPDLIYAGQVIHVPC